MQQMLAIGQTGLYLLHADGSSLKRLGGGYLHSDPGRLDR